MFDQPYDQTALCRDPARQMACDYLREHAEALANAALILGGAPAALRVETLINEVQSGTGRLSLHTRRRIVRLQALLSLDLADDADSELFDFSCAVNPGDPRVHEICKLSDGLVALLSDLEQAEAARPANAVKVRLAT